MLPWAEVFLWEHKNNMVQTGNVVLECGMSRGRREEAGSLSVDYAQYPLGEQSQVKIHIHPHPQALLLPLSLSLQQRFQPGNPRLLGDLGTATTP